MADPISLILTPYQNNNSNQPQKLKSKSHYNSHNPIILIIIPNNQPMIHQIKDQQVQKYLPLALDLLLNRPNPSLSTLNKKQRITITKLTNNINWLCKLNKKQVIELLKTAPSYQPVLGQLYFEQALNDWRLITGDAEPMGVGVALGAQGEECVGVEYRIQFTLASIGKKKGVQAVILMAFFMGDGSVFKVYFNLSEFEKFRYQVANAMKSVYSIEMKTVF